MYELVKFATEQKIKFPELTDDIDGIVELCEMEIEEGSSETHEIQLATEQINQLIEEHTKK